MFELSDYLSVSLSEYEPMILDLYKEGIWASRMCRVLRVQRSVLLGKLELPKANYLLLLSKECKGV